MRAIFSMRDTGPRGVALIECLDDATAADMMEIAGMLSDLHYHQYQPEIDLVFERWVLMDGEAAMAWQDEHGFSDAHTRPMLIAWAASDPRAAFAWVKRNKASRELRAQDIGHGSTKKNMILGFDEAVLRGWAQRDPMEAAAFRFDPANLPLFQRENASAPMHRIAQLGVIAEAIYDCAGTTGLTKWLPQLQSLSQTPPDLASTAFSLMCEKFTNPLGMSEDAFQFLRASVGLPWCAPDTVRDTLWKSHGYDDQAVLDAGKRLGPDPATGAPWFTPESVAARRKAENERKLFPPSLDTSEEAP